MALLFLSAPNLAYAEAATEPVPAESIRVTGSQISRRANDVTAKVVIAREELQRYGDANLADALRRLPGVTVSGGIRLRGLGEGYTEILINGDKVPQGFSIESLSPDMIERVEILRSATADSSAQAIAGTINILLRKSVSKKQQSLKASAERIGERNGGSLGFQLADKQDDLSYSLVGTLRRLQTESLPRIDQSGFDADGRENLRRHIQQINRETTDSISLTPQLNWAQEADSTLTWQGFIDYKQNQYSSDNRTNTQFGAPSVYPHFHERSSSDTTLLRNDLIWSRSFETGHKLNAKLSLSHLDRKKNYDFLGYDTLATLRDLRHVDSTLAESGLGSNGKYAMPVGSDHQLAFGWELAHAVRKESRSETDRLEYGSVKEEIDERYRATVRKAAGFIQDEWQVTPNWQTYMGVRWEGLYTHSESNISQQIDTRSSVWSPVFQTLWKIPGMPKDRVRFAFNRSYKAPTTASLVPRRYVEYNDNSPTNPSRQGNPKLRPELSWGGEFTYEHYFAGNGLLSLNAYARTIDDVMVQHLFQDEAGSWISTLNNKGKADIHGVGLESKLPLRTLWADAAAVDIQLDMSWNWSRVHEVKRPDNRLDEQVPFSANLGLTWAASDQLTLGGNFNYKRGASAAISDFLTKHSETARILDLYATWKVNGQTQLRLTLGNLLGQDAKTWIRSANAGANSLRSFTTPSDRTIKLLLDQKF
ncbi:TonB-dependent receptor [Chitinimonas viridis]|uniref:TonB-dependent receptor n=1 Tax=Chitinimonas viridis TaxID=664880 RepID=A0ABT8B4C3_9NEIS|nr:TonB-dependent receptor [Chitinimonas viridis]MDN3576672.1 TonB-dependent receptor [Chitinimonas viridis]